MSSLWDIAAERLFLMSEVEEAEGELTPELEDALKINEDEVEFKIKDYFHIIKMKEAEILVAQEEMKRLSAQITKRNNLIERLKSNIKLALELWGNDGKSGNKQLKYDTLNVYNVYNKPVVIDDEVKFNNPEFIRLTVKERLTVEQAAKVANLLNMSMNEVWDGFDKHIMKKELKEALINGTEVEGVKIDKTANFIVMR